MAFRYETLQDEIVGFCHVEHQYPTGWPRHAECPCCGSDRLRFAFAKFELAHDVCRRCRFVFMNPYPSEAFLTQLYNSSFMVSERQFLEMPKARAARADASNSMPEKHYARILDRVGAYRRSGTWLDVGGGIGTFLNLARTRFPGFQTYLNEMSRVSADFARDCYGLSVVSDPLETIIERGERFNVISIVAVLEHITHPRVVAGQLYRLLKPGGILLITVPNFTRLNRWLSHGEAGTVVPPYHVSHFNRHNLIGMLRGLGPLTVRHVWDDGPPAFFFIHLAGITDTHHVIIPAGPVEALESVRRRDYTRDEVRLIKRYTRMDNKKWLREKIELLDGRIYLHTIVQKPM